MRLPQVTFALLLLLPAVNLAAADPVEESRASQPAFARLGAGT